MLVTKPIDLGLLQRELATGGVVVAALGSNETATPGQTELYAFGGDGLPVELPPEAVPIVDAHVAPPRIVDYAGTTTVGALVRTTDATPLEVFRFPCEQKRLYTAALTIRGIDAVSFASKSMEGRFTWKRNTAGAIMVGITVVSDIHDAAAASWAPNAVPQGADIVFTVAGAAGRTIDWKLVGPVELYAPGGLAG